MSHADSRLETPASSFKAAADSGRGYRLNAAELHQGVEDEPGVDDDFIARNLTKLAIYGEVRARGGGKLALKAFKELSYDSFRRYRDRDDYWVTRHRKLNREAR
jgi:membrane-bound lytic murein transglycosylase B